MSSASKSCVPLVVLGAGVIGLTVAYVAACDQEVAFDITIIARDIPGDWGSQAWASPFAGANWSPMLLGATDERVRKWEQITFDRLWEMIPSGLVKRLPSKIFTEIDDTLANPWWKDLVRDFSLLLESEIPAPYKIGVGFNTVSVNPLEYLPWLRSELESRGVVFRRQYVGSLDEVEPFVGKNGILVNATSLGSRSLIGVEDTSLYPIRGQSIVVQNSGLQEFLSSRPGATMPEGLTSIIPRPGLTQTNSALLNGTYQIGNWDTSLDMSTAKKIFERCSTLAPCLKGDETKILWHTVGLRPDRKGGPRVEAERISLPLPRSGGLLAPYKNENITISAAEEQRGLTIIHAYGMGAGGYQRSWGVAFEVLSLLKENVQQASEI
ncbi:nucleotide-binding domain-containing protein [Rhizopogon vinicolor AM-OR11-026]|uniref:Nucleotide-binding domain-containing protein n=1 Tax=Rhizopogon vinicolor AM-OR11-026 TaxID=1314800 RepID=A0A1B7NJF2_9AGAM|nr:nucleotide-binding domain-containing protein [Rhizopogon vinicolor AM-OR11-026]